MDKRKASARWWPFEGSKRRDAIRASLQKGLTSEHELVLAIPPNATAQQMAALQQLQAWAASLSQPVNLTLQVVK